MIVTGPAWLHCLIPSCGLRRRIGSALRLKSLFGKLVGSSGILLFYSHLPDKKLVVYPNRRTMVCTACFSDKVTSNRKIWVYDYIWFFRKLGEESWIQLKVWFWILLPKKETNELVNRTWRRWGRSRCCWRRTRAGWTRSWTPSSAPWRKLQGSCLLTNNLNCS